MLSCLTRNEFRNSVFERDENSCVNCGISRNDAKLDAHHIIERRLWPDGGYYLDNGVSLCEPCHLLAESTELTPEKLRQYAGITKVILPPHLYEPDGETVVSYDKWGNPVQPNGRRLRGELFWDTSVQKVLLSGDALRLFDTVTKYPRTMHLPWSPGRTEDDRVIASTNGLSGELIILEKRDGENTTLYSDKLHARSTNGYPPRIDRSRMKSRWSRICGDIPPGWRICGENLVGRHSIPYEDLEDYFEVFSIWNEKDEALSWDETVEWCSLLQLKPVPVLWRGVWENNPMDFFHTFHEGLNLDKQEGYVIRPADGFPLSKFTKCVAKWVRQNHVQTQAHWTRRIEFNTLGPACPA